MNPCTLPRERISSGALSYALRFDERGRVASEPMVAITADVLVRYVERAGVRGDAAAALEAVAGGGAVIVPPSPGRWHGPVLRRPGLPCCCGAAFRGAVPAVGADSGCSRQ